MPLDLWMQPPYETALAHLNGHEVKEKKEAIVKTELKGIERELFNKGKAIYSREGFCITCHQPDGKGLPASGFPPLTGTNWVTGSQDRLIKLVLKGIYGPIEVAGKNYPGQVPMTPFGSMLKDDEIAAVFFVKIGSPGVQVRKHLRYRTATKFAAGTVASTVFRKL